MATKSSGGGHYRSAITGRYVTPGQATRSPRTTVHERGPHKSGGSKTK